MYRKYLFMLVAAAMLVMFSPVQDTSARAEVTISQADFLNAAGAKEGTSWQNGMCLAWVKVFWESMGGPSSTDCCARHYSQSRIASTSRDNIPIGADVFLYDVRSNPTICGTCGGRCGHIGIYMGDGRFISTLTSNGSTYVRIRRISDWENWGYSYAGWGWHDGVRVTNNSAPIIALDHAITSEGNVNIRGWAFDPDDISRQLAIHLYVRDSSDNPIFVGDTIANGLRQDVDSVYQCGAYHGFEAGFYTKDLEGIYTVCVAALDTNGDHAAWANQSNIRFIKDITSPSILDYAIDNISSSGFRVRITASDNVIVNGIRVPTWKSSLGGNYAEWLNATRIGDTSWNCNVKFDTDEATHYSDIYADDYQGNETKALDTIRHTNLTVSFDTNGGTCNIKKNKIAAMWRGDVPLVIYGELPAPSKIGYSFSGWFTKLTGGVCIVNSSFVESKNDHTLYAQWVPNIYSIYYDANGGNNPPPAQNKTHGVTLRLVTDTPTREGYEFLGWAMEANARTPKYQPGDEYSTDSNVTLYAVWQKMATLTPTPTSTPTTTSMETSVPAPMITSIPEPTAMPSVEPTSTTEPIEMPTVEPTSTIKPSSKPSVEPTTEPTPVTLTKITLSKSGTVKLKMGKTLMLKVKVTPPNAEYALTWKSSKPKVATVDGGLVTPVKPGTATITVTADNGVKASVKVKVVAVVPKQITLSKPGTVKLKMGKTLTLKAKVTPPNAESTITWKSSKPKVAIVDDGKVTPVKPGTATITVTTDNGVKASVKVKVVAAKPTKVQLDKKGTLKMKKGDTLQLVATLTPSYATTILSWTSCDKKVAKVDEKGKVRALKKGKATITVKTKNGKKAKVKINVI